MNDPRTTLARPIVATFHRKDQRRLVKGETRRYAKIDNALPRATQLGLDPHSRDFRTQGLCLDGAYPEYNLTPDDCKEAAKILAET